MENDIYKRVPDGRGSKKSGMKGEIVEKQSND
jgi:hypothetical protein